MPIGDLEKRDILKLFYTVPTDNGRIIPHDISTVRENAKLEREYQVANWPTTKRSVLFILTFESTRKGRLGLGTKYSANQAEKYVPYRQGQ